MDRKSYFRGRVDAVEDAREELTELAAKFDRRGWTSEADAVRMTLGHLAQIIANERDIQD